MNNNRQKSIIENQTLNQRIVYSVNKAVTQDVPFDTRENRLETNNRQRFAPGDYINDNVRKYVVDDGVELISFMRHGWEGRIIADRFNKVTYTISTHQTLSDVIAKYREHIHYLRSILHVQNGDCAGFYEQMTLGDYNPVYKNDVVDEQLIEDDYDRIMRGNIGKTDGYKHYIIAYTAKHHTLLSIDLLLLDKGFNIVDSVDLMKYVNPDYVFLDDNQYEEAEQTEKVTGEKRTNLVNLRQGVKPALRSIEKKA